MPAITINLPQVEAEQHIEVEVRINGDKKNYSYRIEILAWEDCEAYRADRANCIREVVEQYDPDWQLVQIGSPTDTSIPIMFKQRGDRRHPNASVD